MNDEDLLKYGPPAFYGPCPKCGRMAAATFEGDTMTWCCIIDRTGKPKPDLKLIRGGKPHSVNE